ncbi:MAG: hypothetical protein QOH26_66, partial [Actinomycetota bacterium]|nr:hypothetical protein [Actinomycetota bacterium]
MTDGEQPRSQDLDLRDDSGPGSSPPPIDPTSLKEYALLAPRLVKLVWKLARDPRVPARSKATLFILAGYLA